jgi:hypothetical protein
MEVGVNEYGRNKHPNGVPALFGSGGVQQTHKPFTGVKGGRLGEMTKKYQ